MKIAAQNRRYRHRWIDDAPLIRPRHRRFAADTWMAIGQVAASDKESEIIPARTLPDLIDLKSALVTGDALKCQGETARLINDRGGNWLFTPKANHPVQHAEVSDRFADPVNRQDEEHTTTDADTGRIEVSHHAACHDVGWMPADRRHPDQVAMPGLAMPGMVEASVTRDGKTTTARRFYLPSVAMGAARFTTAVRAHWRIENSPHRVRDVGFEMDRARNRRDHGPKNLTIPRKHALNVLRTARPDLSIRRKRKRSGWSDEFARSVLGQMR